MSKATKTTMPGAAPPAGAGPAACGAGWPLDPMGWGPQALALGMSAWMAWWQLGLHWMSLGSPATAALDELPSWMVWHNGTEQLA